MASVRIVCFDLGGVVIRICRSFEEAALAAGIPLRANASDPASAARRGELVALHQRGELRAREFHRLMSESFEGRYGEAEIARAHAAVLQGEYPGMAELIRTLGELGLVTACLSNTNDEHWAALLESPALRALHHRHASHLWGLEKPDAAIYRRFERERGAVGAEILFFDDLPANVATARDLGWDAVLVDPTLDPALCVLEALARRGITLAFARSR